MQETGKLPAGITIYNASSIIPAAPGSYITASFDVVVGNVPKTILLDLHIATNGASAVYTLPVVVSEPKPTNQMPVRTMAILAVAAIAIAVAVYAVMRGNNGKPKFDSNRYSRMEWVKNHMGTNRKTDVRPEKPYLY